MFNFFFWVDTYIFYPTVAPVDFLSYVDFRFQYIGQKTANIVFLLSLLSKFQFLQCVEPICGTIEKYFNITRCGIQKRNDEFHTKPKFAWKNSWYLVWNLRNAIWKKNMHT